MTEWHDCLAQHCEDYLDGIVSGRIKNGDPEALLAFQQRVAPMLGPVSLLALVKAWKEKYSL